MAKRELNVFLYGDPVGTLTGSGSLITGFRYQSGYSGAALSRSMPITKRSVGRQTASAWFTGLLPEGEELRRAMADAHGSRDTTSMGLLESAGLDCAGAVQVAPEGDLPEREQRFEPITG
ncbi:HipA N-terminal domain-containing protein [Leucobacter denitrificans]|uniref:HipA N-terminal domain-containing protein n=1 Tax=Leucobacter denitrificans TaxID=683042 RepID=A0A7G9S786_9MICO|nr:HipA N-terminal domain-containing protein [Leucobacter denitrificans]QNN63711.1 HipA N-terminal domain-containing protein [Leucobacter denitrificans]